MAPRACAETFIAGRLGYKANARAQETKEGGFLYMDGAGEEQNRWLREIS